MDNIECLITDCPPSQTVLPPSYETSVHFPKPNFSVMATVSGIFQLSQTLNPQYITIYTSPL